MLLLFLLLTNIQLVKSYTEEEVKAHSKSAEHLTGQALVDYINSHQNLYKAKYEPGIEEFVRSRIMKSKYMEDPLAAELMESKEVIGDDPLPERQEYKQGPLIECPVYSHEREGILGRECCEIQRAAMLRPFHSFDSREHWPKCAEVIGHIRDQSECGSCWALANVEVMSDRLCIQSNGKYAVHLSDTDLLACCGSICGYGCEGGYVNRGWPYFKTSGICTGGPYGDKKSCKPYAFYPCGKHENQTYYGPCPFHNWETPICRKTCQLRSRKNYESDKFYGGDAYVLKGNETAIRREIMTNGPVLVSFVVFGDFYYYTGGIYEHYYSNDGEGVHAVKIIGWGVDERTRTKYWLVANSWNTDWGEKGFFRIIRGQNECGIEVGVIGGKVDLTKIH